ncbi:MAG: leucine-rich repeat protein [Muribaculaceae bacterium]|nr:leucine-rich repeat protein [Muribaculaceae bacterium]
MHMAIYEIKDGIGIIPKGTSVIADNAFYGCTSLSGHLTIPDSVTWIGEYAFDGCSGLKVINVPAKKSGYYKEFLPKELHHLIVGPLRKSLRSYALLLFSHSRK